jgi:hypothetical protein
MFGRRCSIFHLEIAFLKRFHHQDSLKELRWLHCWEWENTTAIEPICFAIHLPVKFAAIKFPGTVKNKYRISFDLSLAAGSLKVTSHSFPFLPSTCSIFSCLRSFQMASILPAEISFAFRFDAHSNTTSSEAGFLPWKWQSPPASANA